MGYTHYWRHKGFTTEQWLKLVEFARLEIQNTKVPIVNGSGQSGTMPKLDAFHIQFNGEEDDSHETFHLTKAAQDFEFCKTAQKPYDEVVVSIMREALRLNPNFKPSSDGGWAVFGTEDCG